MKLRTALTVILVAPFPLMWSGPVAPTYAAAATCQGQPATIESSSDTVNGTEGNDVIVTTGPDVNVKALGGNDLVCVVGGTVYTGAGDDAVVSSARAGAQTIAYLSGGTDTYAGGAGSSDVIVDEITAFHVAMGRGTGTLKLFPTSTPGTGTVDFGASHGALYALGKQRAEVDLAAQTASIDGLLDVTTIGLDNATATGCEVRMRGDDRDNFLTAYGHDIVASGGGGRDSLGRVGNGFRLDLPTCGRHRSVFRGQRGPDNLFGRRGSDVLIGGPGRDVADGAGGVDTCRSEVRKNCER